MLWSKFYWHWDIYLSSQTNNLNIVKSETQVFMDTEAFCAYFYSSTVKQGKSGETDWMNLLMDRLNVRLIDGWEDI